MGHLRSSTQHGNLQLEILVVESATNNKAYTPLEKFNYMVNKQPLLLKLKQELGLDTDY